MKKVRASAKELTHNSFMDAHITSLAQEITAERAYIGSDYVGIAEMLRHVAACNADASRKDFVAAAKLAGINEHTARIQFANSRKISVECDDGGVLQADGRIIYPN